MKSISFKNFRRFTDFPEFKFGEITILVGGNNGGKSTLLKALILLLDNLRELKSRNKSVYNSFSPMFSFDMNHIHQLNLGTYARAHKIGAKEMMTFETFIAHFKIIFRIGAVNDIEANSSMASLYNITIIDTKRNVEFGFTPNEMSIVFKEISKNSLSGAAKCGLVEAPASNYLDLIFDKELSVPSNPVARLLYNWIGYQKLAFLEGEPVDLDDEIVKEILTIEYDDDMNNKLWDDVVQMGSTSGEDIRRAIEHGHYTKEDHEANHSFLEDKISTIREIAHELNNALDRLNKFDEVFYIQAHAITQRVLYSIDNRNDYMAQVLHKFARENIQRGTEPDRFLKKWLTAFNIGNDYRVTSIEGEGYTLEIETSEGVWKHLADLGMGSNQLVTLLMELATLLEIKGNCQHPWIIVEEPEQNLHPKMQSLLASLFYELNKNRGFKFMIETHSEYLVRHTQVIVSKMELGEKDIESQNPFKVYYFPEHGIPYDMKYLPSGRFENKFGEGFFDESAKWHMEILKKEKSRK